MADIIAPERAGRAGGPGLSYWLGSKIKNQPLAMEAGAAQMLVDAIKDKSFDAQISGPWASKFIGTKDQRSQYRVTEDGIAIVPIQGTLFDRGEWLGDYYGWMTSYEGLAEQFRRIAKDEAIKSVILDIDSPGGMAAGMFDLVTELADLKKKKKVYAVAANMAASAAYAIGCAAHELYVSRLGMAGSIGVIAMHTSFARMLDQAGVDTTIIFAGDHKADGNAYQALTHGARTEMATAIDQIYADFVRHVAKHRPLEEAAVRATQARIYSGQKAVEAKLADGVKSFEELLDHIRKGSAPSARGQSKKGGRTVSDGNAPAAARPDYDAAIAAALVTIAANSAPKPAAQAAAAEAPAAAASAAPAAQPANAAADAKARIKAIMGCEAAKKRPALANHLALETDIAADQAEAILKASPEEGAATAAPANALAAAMAKPGNSAGVKPDASADAAGQQAAKPSFSSWAAKQPGSKKQA
ncbi:MAG: S49 family peptidase [Hyphomicrobium sp.]